MYCAVRLTVRLDWKNWVTPQKHTIFLFSSVVKWFQVILVSKCWKYIFHHNLIGLHPDELVKRVSSCKSDAGGWLNKPRWNKPKQTDVTSLLTYKSDQIAITGAVNEDWGDTVCVNTQLMFNLWNTVLMIAFHDLSVWVDISRSPTCN